MTKGTAQADPSGSTERESQEDPPAPKSLDVIVETLSQHTKDQFSTTGAELSGLRQTLAVQLIRSNITSELLSLAFIEAAIPNTHTKVFKPLLRFMAVLLQEQGSALADLQVACLDNPDPRLKAVQQQLQSIMFKTAGAIGSLTTTDEVGRSENAPMSCIESVLDTTLATTQPPKPLATTNTHGEHSPWLLFITTEGRSLLHQTATKAMKETMKARPEPREDNRTATKSPAYSHQASKANYAPNKQGWDRNRDNNYGKRPRQ